MKSVAATQKEILIKKNITYVQKLASNISKTIAPWVDKEDLVAYGHLGLVQAAERFDPAKGISFKTFAYYRIRGAIFDGLREFGWLNRNQYAKQKFEESANEFMNEFVSSGKSPSDMGAEEEANELEQVISALIPIYIISLDAAVELEPKDQNDVDPERAYGKIQKRELIRKMLDRLKDQDRRFIYMYYYENKTLIEIGRIMNLSKSWLSRLHTKILMELKEILAGFGVKTPDEVT